MIKERIKSQKGVAVADALIAIFILALFTGFITTLSFNIYVVSVQTKRSVEANNYIINLCEYVDRINIADTTEAELVNYINAKDDEKISATSGNIEELTTPYKIWINVRNYPSDAREGVELVKIVRMELEYKVKDNKNIIEIERVKSKNF